MRRREFIGGLVLAGCACRAGTAEATTPARRPFRGRVELLRVVKHERRLYGYARGAPVLTMNVALGRQPRGPKVREGDGRTPEGRYTIAAARPDSEYHRALLISYPNAEDRARARALGVRPGGQIMLHGLDPAIGAAWRDRHWMFNWTNGCVAVTDAEMDVLWESVALGTPIEILA